MQGSIWTTSSGGRLLDHDGNVSPALLSRVVCPGFMMARKKSTPIDSPSIMEPDIPGNADAVPLSPQDFAEEAPARLAKELGLTFKDLDLLRLALTHRSVLHDWALAMPGEPLPPVNRQSNERLEFLGDSVLGYVVADYLYGRYPNAPEGLLTAKRVSLVRAERLVGWAREVNLADYLYLGQGEKVTENARDRMLAGAFEAIIGALTIDRGLREARKFLLRFIERDEAGMIAALHDANPKGRLQELLQEQYRLPPTYQTISEEGPAHARIFTCEVTINGQQLGVGSGGSKREAEQAAASAALIALGVERTTVPPEEEARSSSTRRRPSRSRQPITE